jgi:O-antigen ligase
MAIARLRAVPAPQQARAIEARGALFWLLAFVVNVYASTSQLIPALEKFSPGKTLIAASAVALGWSWLRGRPLRLGYAVIYLFFGIVLASPLWSMDPHLSTDAAGEALKYVVAIFIAANVLDSRERLRLAGAVIALATLFPAIGAITSWLAGEHLVEGTRAAWIGTFGNPNFLAYHLILSTPIALALRDEETRPALKLGWLGVIVSYAIAVFLTQSRGGALGFGAVLLLWTIRGLARGRIAIGGVLALGIALLMTPGGPWNREDTTKTLHGEVDASAQGRIDAWRTGLRIVEARPFGGTGIGAFVVGYDAYAPGDAGPARTGHNSFLMITAELGVPALALFVIVLLQTFVGLGRIARRAGSPPLARGLQTCVFGFVVCSLTGGYAFTWPIYLVLGMAAAVTRLEGEVSEVSGAARFPHASVGTRPRRRVQRADLERGPRSERSDRR